MTSESHLSPPNMVLSIPRSEKEGEASTSSYLSFSNSQTEESPQTEDPQNRSPIDHPSPHDQADRQNPSIIQADDNISSQPLPPPRLNRLITATTTSLKLARPGVFRSLIDPVIRRVLPQSRVPTAHTSQTSNNGRLHNILNYLRLWVARPCDLEKDRENCKNELLGYAKTVGFDKSELVDVGKPNSVPVSSYINDRVKLLCTSPDMCRPAYYIMTKLDQKRRGKPPEGSLGECDNCLKRDYVKEVKDKEWKCWRCIAESGKQSVIFRLWEKYEKDYPPKENKPSGSPLSYKEHKMEIKRKKRKLRKVKWLSAGDYVRFEISVRQLNKKEGV